MKPYKLMVAIGYHAVDLTARMGTGVLHLVLDRVYGPPKLTVPAGAGVSAARRATLRKAARSPGPLPCLASDEPRAAIGTSPSDVPVSAVNVPLASERIVTAQLVGPHGIVFGVMWLYLYPRLGIARRVLKVTDPHLAKAFNRDRFVFKEVVIDADAGSRGMLDQLHAECLAVLNRRKARQREQLPTMPRKSRQPRVLEDGGTAPLQLAAAASSGAAVAMESASAEPIDAVSCAQPVAMPRRVRGDEYQGVVTMAGLTLRNGADGSHYRTFCLTVNDGAREVPLFGMELERQACDLRIRPGDRVRVIYMGREPLNLPGQSRPSYRNLYQLSRMESTS